MSTMARQQRGQLQVKLNPVLQSMRKTMALLFQAVTTLLNGVLLTQFQKEQLALQFQEPRILLALLYQYQEAQL